MAICNNTIIDVSQERGSIYLGVWDTLNVKEQKFDVSAWFNAFGADGQLIVLNQRNGDELPYEVADVTVDGTVVTWTFDEMDTALAGEGQAALVYIKEDEIIARTTPYPTYVAPTIGMGGVTPPDPWEDWYTRVLEASATAEQAATDAGAAQTAAETAATAAETAQGKAERDANRAENQATRAVNAAVDARDARAAAIAAQTAAETAQGKAEDAQGLAEAAELAARNAQIAAETAQGKSEAAQTAAETAQGKAEDAQAAAEAAAADAALYRFAAFATDNASGSAFSFGLGADEIPAKSCTAKVTAGTVPVTLTIRRHGKNHFDRNAVKFKIGYLLNTSGNETQNSSYMYSETYIPVLPNTAYVFSGIYPPGSTGTGAPVSCYRADKSFIERKSSGTATNPKFTTPADCYFIRFNCPAGRGPGLPAMYSGNKIATDVNIQIEVGTTATAYESYAQKDVSATVAALNTPTEPSEPVTTALGNNWFFLFPSGALDNTDPISVTATMDMVYRLDPTLVYNSLRG